jgi:hypothetical protein
LRKATSSVGLRWCLPIGRRRPLIALAPTELIVIDGDGLRAKLAADAELASAVYSVLLEAIARRLTETRHELLDLFAQPVFEPW